MRRQLWTLCHVLPSSVTSLNGCFMQWQGNRPFGKIAYAVGFTIQTICNMISGNKIKQAGCLKKGYGDQSFPTVLWTYSKSPKDRGCFLEFTYLGFRSNYYPLERGLSQKAWQQLLMPLSFLSVFQTFEGHDASVLKIIFVSRGTQLLSR